MSIPEDIIEHAHKGTATKKDAFELLDVNPFELVQGRDSDSRINSKLNLKFDTVILP